MRNLLNFFLKYNHCFLFVLLELLSFTLLFRFNHYQGSVFFTSSNRLVGSIYEVANQVTGYFHLKSINDNLVQKNVELELQMEYLRNALVSITRDSASIDRLKKDALDDYDIYNARVINNSLTHIDNYITIDKGNKNGISRDMGVVDGNGIVGIVYLTSDNYSVIIPVLNSKSNISCKIKRSDYFGFLKWEGGSSESWIVKDMARH